MSVDQRLAAGRRRREEALVELLERAADQLAHGLAVARVLAQRGRGTQAVDDADELVALGVAVLRPVDAGEIGREVEHRAAAEVRQVRAAGGQELCQRALDDGRQDLLLVVVEEILLEDLHLEQPALAMVFAVQRDEHAIEHDPPLVVEGLLEVGQGQRLVGFLVTGDGDVAHRFSPSEKGRARRLIMNP